MNTRHPGYVLGFMAVIATVFGSGVALVHNLTLGKMKENEQLHRNRTIARAFDLQTTGTSAQAYEEAVSASVRPVEITHEGRTWDAFVRTTAPHDIGFVFRGIGFWDAISGIMVMSSDLSSIVNIQFLDQKETPGLGARITETPFTDQFRGKEVSWESGDGVRFIIGPYPEDAKNRVDGVTGATQTSRALMITLNASLDRFRKAWQAHRSAFAPQSQTVAADHQTHEAQQEQTHGIDSK